MSKNKLDVRNKLYLCVLLLIRIQFLIGAVIFMRRNTTIMTYVDGLVVDSHCADLNPEMCLQYV